MASLISVGQVLDHSFEHCRKHYKELLAITLWMVVASIPSVVGKLLAPSGEGTSVTNADWLTFSISLVGIITVAVISLWMYATLVLTVSEQANGRATPLKHTYRAGWQSFMPYLLLTLLIGLIVITIVLIAAPGYVLLFAGSRDGAAPVLTALGTPVFLLGATVSSCLLIKYTVLLAFAPYILLLEKKSPLDAIRGSVRLIKGRWWATLLRFAVPKLVYFLVFFITSIAVFTAIEMLMAFIMTSSAFGVLVAYTLSLFLSVFLSAIITPFLIATDYYLYDSLRKTR